MSFALPDDWVWDFWFAVDGATVHVFYLHAPRSLGDPELRHHHARIGHAVSTDLHTWTPLPGPIEPGAPGEFDDLATWTGSVLHDDGRWWLFYTGIRHAERGAAQRIGLATSPDLISWTKHGQVCQADPQWYETFGPDTGQEAWRDPWVFHHPGDRRFHMLVTARANHGPADGRGVIGHAWSQDLRVWHPTEPVSAPGEFAQLEVPQLVHLGGRWRVLFCAWASDHSAARRARGVTAESGTHYLSADHPLGPYTVDDGPFLLGGRRGSLYAGRLLHHRDRWWLFAWHHLNERGEFIGALSDPMPVRVDNRRLVVDTPSAHGGLHHAEPPGAN